MQVHLIYHCVKPGIDCPDGITAAAGAFEGLLNLRHTVTVAPGYYQKEYAPLPDIEIPKGTERITIVDFAYPKEWIQHWLDAGLDVEILEHHADKFPWLEGFSGAVLDEKECGSTLAWKRYFNGDPLPELLKHVRNRDIGSNGYYEGLIPESEAINLGYGSFRASIKYMPIEEQLQAIYRAIVEPKQHHSFAIVGAAKIEERDRLINECLPKTTLSTIPVPGGGANDGIPCAFYDFTNDRPIAQHYSILGHRMCAHHGVAIAHMVDGKANHLRSLKSFPECSRIAKAHGGGGHPCASGWQA